jgi:hypothetical protein
MLDMRSIFYGLLTFELMIQVTARPIVISRQDQAWEEQTTEMEYLQPLLDAVWNLASSVAPDQIQN